MTGSASDYYAVADQLLNVCEQALALLPAGTPERAYVAHGLPAIDCEQLCVSSYVIAQMDTAPRQLPGDAMFKPKYGSVNVPVFVISIVRCYPVVTLDQRQEPIFPSVAELTAASQLLYADAWQLWNAVQTAKREGAFDGLCSELRMDPVNPIQPNGGFAGWTLPVEIELDGFTVPFPP